VPFWAAYRFVVGAILVYLAVHFAVRMAMWPTLGIDDAEQALFAQEFAWNYRFRGPPLFTWMLLGLGKLIGINILSLSLLRYTLLGCVFVFAFLTARRLIADPRLSALSVYSFGAIYMFAFYSHHDFTHTTIMSAMLAVGWYIFVRLAASPRLGWYIALGAVFGLGLLGKWNFAMFAAALPLACLLDRSMRPLVLTWKVGPALAACGLVVAPTVVAALSDATAQDMIRSTLVAEGEAYLAGMTKGILRLALAIIAYPEPLLPLVLVIFAAALWRGVHTSSRESDTTRPSVGFLFLTIAVSLSLHLALVLALGATEISERLLQPPLFILPIALFMLIERGTPTTRAVNIYAATITALVMGTLAARIVVYVIGSDYCGSCRNMAPFYALADEIRSAGYSGSGTILVAGLHIGGNMRVEFPEARVIDADYPLKTWPGAREEGQCLLLWQDRDPDEAAATRQYLHTYLEETLRGPERTPDHAGLASALMFGSDKRQYRMRFELYDEPAGDCR